MAKMMIARKEDKGMSTEIVFVLITTALICGVVGVPIGAILSKIMQEVLHNSLPPVRYGFFLAPIFFAMLLGFLFMKKQVNTKNHTICEKCKGKLHPMTEMDAVFTIPVKGDQEYTDPYHYLAENMEKVSSVGQIPLNQRACYVCCYECRKCGKRIVRISDFLPLHGTCDWRETYYYDMAEFLQARGKDDLR